MATPAQIAANRLNAQRSTGPRSPEGKAAVRFNALKHGADAESRVIPGEDAAALEALSRSYFDQLQPAGPLEVFLVETIVRADWAQRRLARIEAELLNHALGETENASLGAVFQRDAAGPNALNRIFRRQQAAQRDWYRALTELRRLQQARLESALNAPDSDEPPSEVCGIGFVPPPPGEDHRVTEQAWRGSPRLRQPRPEVGPRFS